MLGQTPTDQINMVQSVLTQGLVSSLAQCDAVSCDLRKQREMCEVWYHTVPFNPYSCHDRIITMSTFLQHLNILGIDICLHMENLEDVSFVIRWCSHSCICNANLCDVYLCHVLLEHVFHHELFKNMHNVFSKSVLPLLTFF